MAGETTLCKRKPLVMGIVNVTPDSFFDGGKYYSPEAAIRHGLRMAEEGADIIDIGGESTKPFSKPVSIDEELQRIIPVIEGIRAQSNIPISIDTYRSKVAEEACKRGAHIVNDISGLTFDEKMVNVVCEFGTSLIIMHIKGRPDNMQENPFYDDVVSEIKAYFKERMDFATNHGVREENIILDPGIGFGKRVEDNLKIIKHISDFKELGRPILIGTSMKSFIGKITDSPLHERTEGTIASIAICVWNGADIVRVHDVRGAKKAIQLVDAVMQS